MAPAPRQYPTLEGWNQNKLRTVTVLFDQHRSKDFPYGRPWWGYAEDPAAKGQPRGFSGELSPISEDLKVDDITVKGWDAPWIPEPKYVLLALQTVTSGNRFRFDYERMVADRKEAMTRYYTLAAREAAARNWPAPSLYGPVSFQLRAIVGNPPKSPKLPEAALAGDPWLLGFSQKRNDVLVEILLDEQGRSAEFLASADATPKQSGLLAEILAMSAEDRAALKALLGGETPKSPKVPSAA